MYNKFLFIGSYFCKFVFYIMVCEDDWFIEECVYRRFWLNLIFVRIDMFVNYYMLVMLSN